MPGYFQYLLIFLCFFIYHFPLAIDASPPKDPPPNWGNTYLSMTMGDFGQKDTYQAQALSWITGTLCSDTFLPPGEVADYFGFQYFRDSDSCGMGHNSNFAMYAANALLNNLNDTQRRWLLDLAYTEFGVLNITFLGNSSASSMVILDQIMYGRISLQMAFRKYSLVLENKLNINQVIAFSEKLYILDSHLTMNRVQVFARIIKSLSATQLQTLSNYGCMLTWPNSSTDTTWNRMNGNYIMTLYQTYAGELFAWFKGSKNSSFADPYFAPERQADYFGLFYLKDINAVSTNAQGIATIISSQLTGDLGASMYSVLNNSQKQIMDTLVQTQRSSLYSFYYGRRNITSLLRQYLQSGELNKTSILSAASLIGKNDGIMAFYYAVAFNKLKNSLNSTQARALQILRSAQNLPDCHGYWYFSWNEAMPRVSPELVTFFFSPNGTGSSFLNFASLPSGTISVTQPSLFASFVAGQNVSVTWSFTALASSFVHIYLFSGSSLVQTLSSSQGTPAVLGSFVGNLGGAIYSSSVCRIKVVDSSQPTTFGFSSQFSVTGVASEPVPGPRDPPKTVNTGFSMKLTGVTAATLQNFSVKTHVINKFAQHVGVSPGQVNMTVTPVGTMLVVSMMVSDLTPQQLASVNAAITLSNMTSIVSTCDPALANVSISDIQVITSIPPAPMDTHRSTVKPAMTTTIPPAPMDTHRLTVKPTMTTTIPPAPMDTHRLTVKPTLTTTTPPTPIDTHRLTVKPASTVTQIKVKIALSGVTAATMNNQTIHLKVAQSFATKFGVSISQINVTVIVSGTSRRILSSDSCTLIVTISSMSSLQASTVTSVVNSPSASITLAQVVSQAAPAALSSVTVTALSVSYTSTVATIPPTKTTPISAKGQTETAPKTSALTPTGAGGSLSRRAGLFGLFLNIGLGSFVAAVLM